MRMQGRPQASIGGETMKTVTAVSLVLGLWLVGPSGVHAQTCEFGSHGMCAKSGAVCSPIDNSDKSSAKNGACKTVVGRRPTGTTCQCLGKLDVHRGNGTATIDHIWDVAESQNGRDPNGFFRMPNWKWVSGGPNPPLVFVDVCDYCPCNVGAWAVSAPDDQEPLWLAAPMCTHGSSTVTPPLHENGNHDCADGPAQRFGSDASGIGYHMNWEPVEYEGPLSWEDHSTWTFLDSSGDNEYSFNILRPELFLVTAGRESSGLHLEFNSTEVVDHFNDSGTWWDHPFHHAIDHRPVACGARQGDCQDGPGSSRATARGEETPGDGAVPQGSRRQVGAAAEVLPRGAATVGTVS